MSGKRRRPWVTCVTLGWDDNGKQLKKTLGYSETRSGALKILEEYHVNPYDLNVKNLSFESLYERWFDWKFDSETDLSKKKKSMDRYRNAYKYYKNIHKMNFIDINFLTLQSILDNCTFGYSTKSDILSLYRQLFDYAKIIGLPVKEVVTKSLKLGEKKKSELHSSFTEEEIDILWKNTHIIDVELILIDIYTGQRPSELINPTEIHIDKKYIISGIKTEAGIDRIIPLHERIIALVEKNFVNNILDITYSQYQKRFEKVMELLKMEHIPGDCRHTFATRADNCGMNKLCEKLILGHTIQDITDGTYTHKTLKELLEAVNLLK